MDQAQRMGDEQAGFSVSFDATTSTVRVRAWGFMSPEVAGAFGVLVRDACRSSPRRSALVMDMNELKPMRDEGQASFCKLMEALPSLHMSSTTVLVTSQLVKLQLLRLANQTAAKGLLRFA
jgi:hypothetical protein